MLLGAEAVGATLGGGLGGVKGAGTGLETSVIGEGDALHNLVRLLDLLDLLDPRGLLLLLLMLLPLLMLLGHEEGEVGIGVGPLEGIDGGIDDGPAVRRILARGDDLRGNGARGRGGLGGGSSVGGTRGRRYRDVSHELSPLLLPLLGDFVGQRGGDGLDFLPDLPLADRELLLVPLEATEAQEALGGGLGAQALGGGRSGRCIGQARRGANRSLLTSLDDLGGGELSLLMPDHRGRGRVGDGWCLGTTTGNSGTLPIDGGGGSSSSLRSSPRTARTLEGLARHL